MKAFRRGLCSEYICPSMSRKYKYNSRTTTPGHKTTERRKVASLARRSHTLFVIIVAFASVVTYMTARMLRHERRSVQLYMRVADGSVFLENVRPREVFREIETELADMHKIDVQDKYTVKKMKSPIQFPRVILQNITSAAEMIISPPTSLCKKTHIYFMILIFSEESKAPLRDIIRKTWCKQNKHRNNSVSTCVFVVGKSNSDENNFAKAVTAESKKHGDIMLMPFLDDVRNSSLKLITAFKWIRTNCPNVNYVMRTQDDVIVNTNKLVGTVLTSAPATRFVAGKCQDATPPIRNAYSKFYVPEDLYPHAKYPPVCSNMGYIMSGDVIEILYAESFKHMTIPLDDVFIGVMLEAVSERVKLVSLIRAWRAKYDKMHTAAQRHRDVIETLKQEIKQIKEERDRVNGHLTAELEKEKNVNNAEMGRLREQADTAQKEAAIESRILKEKLHKLQTDTKPIIDTYKERDAKMNSKIEEMTETLQKLTEERQTLEKELENLKSDSQKQIEEVKIENEVLKTRYQDKMQEVKQHIALSVAQIRRKAEEESMTSQNQLREEFDRKYETLQTRSNHSVKVVEIQLQADFQRKVKENEQKFEEQKCALVQHYEVELKTCRKKLELTKSKYRQSSKENQRLHEALATTRNKLQIMRTNLGSDVYDDVLQNHQQHVKAVVSRKNLLIELAMRMREIRDLRRELERHERNQKFGADVRWQEEGIKLEILHSAKIAEIDELKKMIRKKQVESIYKSRATLRPQPIETVLKTPDLGSFVHSDYHSNLPVRTSLSAGANSNRRGQERLKPPEQKQKRKIDKTKVEDRSAWLTRKNSTIQFNPVTGGEARQNMQIRRQMNDNRETTFQLQHL